ncbi:MAG: S8 family serine peptidase [Acidobacteriia bacterium]|nr:S8 family serine peptidase [Terriglobia bacterium]
MCLLTLLAATIAAAQRQGGKPDLPNLAPNKPSYATPSRPYFAADRLIVRFRAGKSPSARAAVHGFARGRTKRLFRTLRDIEVVQLESGLTLSEALRRYRSQADVLYAEPDYRRTLFDLVPNDPMFTGLWGLRNTGQSGGLAGADIDAVKAWELSTGSSDVVVGTIDTGVDWNHPDLAANIYRNDADCTDNGIDDDGNGVVDDCHGFNAVAGSGDPIDTYKHGTHVAGTIGAVGNNGLGVVGVNWKVKILACKTDDENGYLYDSAILSCLDYMATMKDRGVNIVATNNSYGGAFESKAVTDAIREQMKRGILFVAAAGNYGLDNDTIPAYPANTDLPNVLTVAATDYTDGLASFSDYGRHTVHLGAPGVAITSTVPGGGYETWDGTSMATPHVVGAAALLKAYDPAQDWAAIKNRILAGGDPLASMTATISGRRLNAYGAMTCAGQEVLARLQPQRNNVYVAIGETVTFNMLHVVCEQPAGELTLSMGNGPPLTLHDDGQNGDEAAGDGVYTARWVPPAAGRYTATFSNGEAVTVIVLKPYTFSKTDYSWRTITGTFVPLDWFYGTPIAIVPPFPVRFGGLTFDSLAIDAYGTIEMLGVQEDVGWGLPEWAFPIPTVFADTLVAPLWDDIFDRHDLDPAQGVYWDVLGQAPNRELVIEWRGFHHYTEYSYPGAPSTVTFQVVLSETSDDIVFNYADTTFDNEWYDFGRSASVGIQVSQGVGMQFSCFAPMLSPELAVRWSTSDSLPTSIELLWPNGGEVWRPGEKHNIAWNATGPAATDFRIELLKADAIDSVPTTSVPAASGSFAWTMPLDKVRGNDYKIRLVSNADSTITHTSVSSFIIDNVYVLEVWPGYWGTGTVTSSPPGIQCHEVCHAPFAAGTTLTLTATPDPGNQFNGWDGPCTGTGPCVITMTKDIVVAADFVPLPPDFSFTAPPPPQTVAAGQPAHFTITISGNNGFAGTVSFACTAGVPPQASCSFSPPTVTAGANPVSTTLTTTTTARSMALLQAPSRRDYRPLLALCLPVIGLVLAPVAGRKKLARRWHVGVGLLLLLLLVAALVGCGGGVGATSPPGSATGTPAGSYSITVTATSGSLSHTQTVTLVVN